MSDFATTDLSRPLATLWHRLLTPLFVRLDQQLDRRLVSTLAQTIRALVEHRHRNHGLLLSELGAYLLSALAPARSGRH